MTLRYYQVNVLDELDNGWTQGHRCQVVRMGTGTGKTRVAARALKDNTGGGLMMAHRREIVAQLALALAREGVRHRVLGPPALRSLCISTQIKDLGTHYVNANSGVGVASTDSLAALKGEEDFLRQVTLAVPDEFHHYVRDNAYGQAIQAKLRASCRLIGPTATPRRTDGLGLGLHAHGFANHMVLGPSEAQMMGEGWLCQYKIYAPPTDFHRDQLHLGASDDFKKEEVKQEVRRSTIFGDAVKHYTERVNGMKALAFVDSLDNANELCKKFRAAGVRAEVLSGKTEVGLRTRTLESFAKPGGVDMIISVQLIDEGFDCPTVQVVLDLAPTTSIIRYRQRFGRGWRPDESKDFFYYFDFVGNVKQHGLPDAYCEWTLNARERRSAGQPSDEVPTRVCDNPACNLVYSRIHARCPYCAQAPTIMQRNGPAFVDGDLIELDEATLRAMRGDIASIDGAPKIPHGASYAVAGRLKNVQFENQQAQAGLRKATGLWGGWQEAQGRSLSEGYRRFYFRYGIDLMSAWALKAADATALEEKIRKDLNASGIIDLSVN